MGREERFAVYFEEFFAGIEKSVDPGEEFTGGVVGMEDHGNAVVLGHLVHVHGAGDGSGNGGIHSGDAFTGIECASAV